jgi:Mn2+/Fe2+ NRAMP family transporter
VKGNRFHRVAAVVFWAVIPAAFVGPGTVTTCALAGARHGTALLWALLFSTAACGILQEAAARVSIVTGEGLGRALRRRYDGPISGPAVTILIVGAIVAGCAAYQAGNVLGAVEGAALLLPGAPRPLLAAAIGFGAGLLLWFGRVRAVTRVMAVTVAAMGASFLVVAAGLPLSLADILRGLLLPSFPAGAGVLILGLVGTTIVPYNLFLGSGLARGRALAESRFGLAAAVTAGGIISMGILAAGTAVAGPFGFEAVAAALAERLGRAGAWLFGAGLLAAGCSSAITAPLAAALTARGLAKAGDPRWDERSRRTRADWLGVLLTGVGFGVAGAPPIPAILLAQALNGVLLPLVAAFLFLAVNDRRVLGDSMVNGRAANGAFGAVLLVTLMLGSSGVVRAGAALLGLPSAADAALVGLSLVVTACGGGLVLREILRLRSR